MTVPVIASLDAAIRVYYESPELNNDKIRQIFGEIKANRIANMKRPVLEEMAIQKRKPFGLHTVNTEIAFKVWGLSIDDLERRRAKLLKLGLL